MNKTIIYSLLSAGILSFYLSSSNAQSPLVIKPGANNFYTEAPNGVITWIASPDKGLLLPRVALQSVSSSQPIVTTPATGLLVYNTNAAIIGGAGTGMYYWKNDSWHKLLAESEGENFWSTYGNAGINASTHFIGTTNNFDLSFMSGGQPAGTLGTRNTSMGADGYPGITGNDNTSFGGHALRMNTTGNANTALGYQTMEESTSGTNNVAAGRQALWRNGSGSFNTAVGASNSLDANPGNFNVGIGSSAGYTLSSFTTGVGYYTGNYEQYFATGLGAFARPNCNYCVVLGGTTASPSPATSRVKVGIGTNFPTTDLEIRQNSSTTTSGIKLTNSGGTHNYRIAVDGAADINFYRNGTLRAYIEDATGNYVISSDQRLKKQITPMQRMLPTLMKLKPKTYRYKQNDDDSPLSYGFLAQEVESLLPDFVRTLPETGQKGLDYGSFAVVAIKAIQEQQEQIDQRNREIDALMQRLEALEKAAGSGKE